VHPRDHEHGRVIPPLPRNALLDGLLLVPSLLPRELLLVLPHPAQELNVPATKQVEPAIDVDDPLPGL
jgi:hypothetical protein